MARTRYITTPRSNSFRNRSTLFKTPSTFILNEEIENDVRVTGAVYDFYGNYGTFSIDGIDVQNGDLLAGVYFGYGKLTAWVEYTIDTYGGLGCSDGDWENPIPGTPLPSEPGPDGGVDACLNSFYRQSGFYIAWEDVVPNTQQGWFQSYVDELGMGDQGQMQGIFNFETTGDGAVQPGGEFTMEQCPVFTAVDSYTCHPDYDYPDWGDWGIGTWDRYKIFVGEIGTQQGTGGIKSRMVTLNSEGYVRFGKSNTTAGTVYTQAGQFDQLEPYQAGNASGVYTVDGSEHLTIRRWAPNQICKECTEDEIVNGATNCSNGGVGMGCTPGLVLQSELFSPQGTKYEADLIDNEDGSIGFENATIVSWNDNIGTWNVGGTPFSDWGTEYPDGMVLEGGIEGGRGYDILNDFNIDFKTHEFAYDLLPQPESRPGQFSPTLHPNGTWDTSLGLTGTWQLRQDSGRIELTGTYNESAPVPYREYKNVAGQGNYGSDFSYGRGNPSAWDQGTLQGIHRTTEGTWGVHFSKPLDFNQIEDGLCEWVTYQWSGGNWSAWPDDIEVDCCFQSDHKSFACQEAGNDYNNFSINYTSGNVVALPDIHDDDVNEQFAVGQGQAFWDDVWWRGSWLMFEGTSDFDTPPGSFSGIADWTHIYGSNAMNNIFECNSFEICDSHIESWCENTQEDGNNDCTLLFSFGREGSDEIAPYQIGSGDITGDAIINILDVVTMVSAILGTSELTTQQFLAADITGDEMLSVLDLVALLNTILTSSNVNFTDEQTRMINNFSRCLSDTRNLKKCQESVGAYV
tara:strand:+ start:857 stop:3250 length:2394 start_codon:yes stop_codon:yes gene_type:complete